jgi:hypothetical protein
MNISQNKLNEYIILYLNDIDDYGDKLELTLAENALSPIKNLLLESKQDASSIIKEALSKSTPLNKEVITDFLNYMQADLASKK